MTALVVFFLGAALAAHLVGRRLKRVRRIMFGGPKQ